MMFVSSDVEIACGCTCDDVVIEPLLTTSLLLLPSSPSASSFTAAAAEEEEEEEVAVEGEVTLGELMLPPVLIATREGDCIRGVVGADFCC